jgi:hypothetical protein
MELKLSTQDCKGSRTGGYFPIFGSIEWQSFGGIKGRSETHHPLSRESLVFWPWPSAPSLSFCGAQDLSVYVAPSLEQLQARIAGKESVWCGWDRFFGTANMECAAHVSPFGESYIAVADQNGAGRLQAGVMSSLLDDHMVLSNEYIASC